jgi:hypothetical protein
LPDIANTDGCTCWTRDKLALANYQKTYAALDEYQKTQVDNVWYNLMSYHERFGYARLTEDQLDRWTNDANGSRRHMVSGQTYYTSPTGVDTASGVESSKPKRHVQASVSAAHPGGGDIILLRAGNYNEQLTISKPVTLRATRAGWATIGRP